jgi:hypothetical protein
VKHKQELAAMKQELQKLQQESKMGQKSKDVTTKDLEAAKKKLQDVEAKLKLAVSDKQAALQVCGMIHFLGYAALACQLVSSCAFAQCCPRACMHSCDAAFTCWIVTEMHWCC